MSPVAKRVTVGLLVPFVLTVTACSAPDNPNTPLPIPTTKAPDTATSPEAQVQQILDARKVDYSEALRTASLKLRGSLPSLVEIKSIESAADEAAKKAAYESLVDAMLASPEFTSTIVRYWKNTFKTGQDEGDAPPAGAPDKNTAANFAAQITVDGRPFADLFTSTENTCPSFDATTRKFTPATCASGPVPVSTAGILTDPGILGQFFSNMAFRRVRFLQETFACAKFPSEFSTTPTPAGNGTFTGTFPLESITGKRTNAAAKIDFQDTSAVICANCHVNLNRLAPLFLNFDANGFAQATSQVEVPIPDTPKAERIDFLPGSENLAWRAGKPVSNLTELAAVMAADPEVQRCAVNRVWNYAMSRGDIVGDLALVPQAVTEPFVKDFVGRGQQLKETFRAIFKSEDFVKY